MQPKTHADRTFSVLHLSFLKNISPKLCVSKDSKVLNSNMTVAFSKL